MLTRLLERILAPIIDRRIEAWRRREEERLRPAREALARFDEEFMCELIRVPEPDFDWGSSSGRE